MATTIEKLKMIVKVLEDIDIAMQNAETLTPINDVERVVKNNSLLHLDDIRNEIHSAIGEALDDVEKVLLDRRILSPTDATAK